MFIIDISHPIKNGQLDLMNDTRCIPINIAKTNDLKMQLK